MRRILVLAAAILLIALPLFAAGSTEESGTTDAGATALNELGTYPLVNTTTELSILTYADVMDFDANWLTLYLEDLTNVDIVWELAPSERFKERMNLMFASGEFTDVINAQGNSLTAIARPEEMRLIQQGVITPLNDLIESDSVWYRRRLEEVEGFREAITAPDGNIYDLGNIQDCFHCKYGEKMWVNEVWLENLGLEPPTTVEEFTEMLRAFKTQDANGNGDPNDEWPLATSKSGAWVYIDGFLMNPFQFTDVGQGAVRRLYVDNGVVKASFMQPGYQEGLRWINQLWEEELIFPDSFTQDRNTTRNINQGDEQAIFGAVPAMHHGYYSAGSGDDARYVEYMGLAPLDGPAGRQTPFYGFTFNTGTTMITTEARNPALAMRFLDFFYSDEGSLIGTYGEPGVDWRPGEPGELAINGQQARVITLERPEDDQFFENVTWGNRSTYFQYTHSWRSGPQDYHNDEPGAVERFLWVWTNDNYEPYGVPLTTMLPPLFYPEDSISELAQIYATLDEFVYESVVRFVTGDLDVDADWGWFQNELEKIGVERYLEITQEAYDMSAFAN